MLLSSSPRIIRRAYRRIPNLMLKHTEALQLNPTETSFVSLLDDFSQTLTPPVECRIAGGWVRDKACPKKR
jgi:hypothetical protein